jgi:arylsulfatase A-like enzyme
MQRRTFLTTLAGGLRPAGAAQAKTNFVFILADDLGVRDLGCYGNPYYATPNLDRLAAQGARFTNAYAACPVCSPTRASIMTGRYPARTGVTDWIPGRPSDPQGPISTPRTATEMKLAETTIAEALKPGGYRSASVGKWHLGDKGFYPTGQGFDVNVGGNHSGSPPRSKRPYFGPFELPNLAAREGEFLPELLTAAAVNFIEQNRANPFFLYFPHYSVHLPLGARPEEIARRQAQAAGRYEPTYAAMVEALDASVGAVLNAIDKAGIADRTMVVFFSDNGGLNFEGKAKLRITDNSPYRAGKGHLYEGGIREPLLMRLAGRIKPGVKIDSPVCSVDFLPTFRDIAGLNGGAVDGVSLTPLFRGGKLKRRELYWHYPHYSNQGGEPGSAIRDGDWKLIEFHAAGRRELFNLTDDMGEKVNLIERRPDIARKLAAKLAAWRKDTGAILPVKNPNADPRWPGFQLTGDEKPTPPARR